MAKWPEIDKDSIFGIYGSGALRGREPYGSLGPWYWPRNPAEAFENMRPMTEEEIRERLRKQSAGMMNSVPRSG